MEYQIFISHAYRDRKIYYDLVQKLNDVGTHRVDWRNLSIQFDMRLGHRRALASLRADVDDEWLREEIGRRITDCELFLVLTKPVASRRRWLQWEILLAKNLGKPVIGIARKRNDSVSSFVKAHADDIVDTWRVEHIVNAIKQYGKEYRARRRLRGQVSDLSPLPADAPDEGVPPTPTALSPAEISELTEADPPVLRPKDLLFRDIQELSGGTPNPVPDYQARVPVWWHDKD